MRCDTVRCLDAHIGARFGGDGRAHLLVDRGRAHALVDSSHIDVRVGGRVSRNDGCRGAVHPAFDFSLAEILHLLRQQIDVAVNGCAQKKKKKKEENMRECDRLEVKNGQSLGRLAGSDGSRNGHEL